MRRWPLYERRRVTPSQCWVCGMNGYLTFYKIASLLKQKTLSRGEIQFSLNHSKIFVEYNYLIVAAIFDLFMRNQVSFNYVCSSFENCRKSLHVLS